MNERNGGRQEDQLSDCQGQVVRGGLECGNGSNPSLQDFTGLCSRTGGPG